MQAYKAQEGNGQARLRKSLKLTGFRMLLEDYMSVIIAAKRRRAELPTSYAGSLRDGASVNHHLSSREVFGDVVASESPIILYIIPDPCCCNSNKRTGSLS